MNHFDTSKKPEDIKQNMQDIIVDTTGISWVDGDNGRLFYMGINISELSAHAYF
jgi:citrate synthase